MKKTIVWKTKYFVGGALIIAAFIIGGQSIAWPFHIEASQISVGLAPATSHVTNDVAVAGKPVRVIVPNRNIALPITDGTYNGQTGEWTLTDTKAQFATMTSMPNNKAGNTLIYGHDTPAVFKNLEQLQPGDEAQIATANGYVFTYRFRSAIDVDPANTSVLHYSGAPILTLQTCSGAWSQNRRLMTFDFIEVHNV